MSFLIRGRNRLGSVDARPVWVPQLAIAHLDFVNGLYWCTDAERDLTEVMSGIDSGVTAGSGVQITTANSNRPQAAALLLAELQSGFVSGITFYQEWSQSTSIDGPLFGFFDHADPDLATDYLVGEDFGSFAEIWPVGTAWAIDTPSGALTNSGTQRLAATLALDIGGGQYSYGISCNGSAMTGGAVEEPTVNRNHTLAAFGPQSAFFLAIEPWAWRYQPSFLRKLTLWDAQPTADLPDISTTGELP